jgi:hypothetical protein
MFESKHESLSILWMNTKHKMYTEVDNNKIFIEPAMLAEDQFVVITQGATRKRFGTPIGSVWKEDGIWNVQIDTEHFKNVLRVEEEIIAELV